MERRRHGRWGAVTALSPLRRGWTPWLRLVFLFGSLTNVAAKPVLGARTIALGRWTLLPRSDRPPAMVFETNWSGAWETYVADLGRMMPVQWWSIWGGDERFPGPLPTTGLLDWVDLVDHDPEHFHTGYRPGATTDSVVQALALRPRLERFMRDVDGLGPDEFTRRWERFMTEVQGLV